MVTTRRLLLMGVCFAVSAFGLILFFRGTHWAELGEALRNGHYVYMVPALFFSLCTYAVRAYRWQILMNPIKRVRWLHLLSATTIGFMTNCVLPLRVGELVRPTVIGIKEKISPATALTTVIVERIFDWVAIGAFVVIVLVLMPADGPVLTALRAHHIGDPRKWAVFVAATTVGAFAFMLLVKRFPSATLNVLRAPLRILPHALSARLTRILMGLIVGLESLKSPAQVLYLTALSVFHWGLIVMSDIALGWCFGLHFSFAEGSLIFVITALAVAVPQGPGFVGVLDCAALLSLQILGVDSSTAQSYAIVLHFLAVVPVTVIGFAFLWWEGLSLRQVTAQKAA